MKFVYLPYGRMALLTSASIELNAMLVCGPSLHEKPKSERTHAFEMKTPKSAMLLMYA